MSQKKSEKAEAIDPHLVKLAKMIKGIRIAMMTTLEPDGILRSRPMATMWHDDKDLGRHLWFFTAVESGKVRSIFHDRHVNISYVDIESEKFASLSGRAVSVNDKKKMKELWNPMLKAWFPKGLEDPHICLLRVDLESGEIWESPGKIAMMIDIGEALIRGKPVQTMMSSERFSLLPQH
jgi:general stress protein 26